MRPRGGSSAELDTVRSFEFVSRIVDLLARSPDKSALLDAALDAALVPLGLARGAIYLRHGDSEEIKLEAHRGIPEEAIARRGQQAIAEHGTGISGTSAHRQGALVLSDLTKEPAAAGLVDAFREAGIEARSAAAVPVVVESRSIGVVLVVSELTREFAPAEVAYLRLVGALLGWTLVGQEALRQLARTNDELKALASALEQRTAELKELDKYKTQSIHLITHEMRKPLTPIFTYADMLLGLEFPPEKQRQFLERIRASADEMNEYIREMIDTAKLEEGGVQLLYEDVDVMQVVRAAAAKWQQEALAAGVALEVGGTLERRGFTTDGVKIGEILENLIENAVKYTPQGGRVAVAVRQASDTLEVSVADTGIGIPPEEIPNLFNKFHIVKKADVPRPTHRAGLGLYLARVYAEALGGSIRVESAPGKGSTFTLRVPVSI